MQTIILTVYHKQEQKYKNNPTISAKSMGKNLSSKIHKSTIGSTNAAPQTKTI